MADQYEIHLTLCAGDVDRAVEFARPRGVKFTHIVLAQGTGRSQPMLTIPVSGSLSAARAAADQWWTAVRNAFLSPTRVKIEAAPWNTGVPQSDDDAAAEPPGRYFEHHVKLVLPDSSVRRLFDLADLVVPHGAHVSTNARRDHRDGGHERFVTQRCHGVGRRTARKQFEALVTALTQAGYQIAESEEEYVVVDSMPSLDNGWLDAEHRRPRTSDEETNRQAPAGSADFPVTYRPVEGERVTQSAVFDPALKHYDHAYRAGEPEIAGPDGPRWHAARHVAMLHLLRLVANAPWGAQLVLRGSVPLRTWLGEAARRPGDLDFVVQPASISAQGPEAAEILGGLVEAVGRDPGPGLRADGVTADDIWTYERAEGRRLAFPFSTPGLPDGTVQVDVVFAEELPLPPVLIEVEDCPIYAAPPELALAWKLLWLASDLYPQGKDLYDATLLAEYTSVPLPVVRDLLRPELDSEADEFCAESVLAWAVDWQNFRDEYPGVPADSSAFVRRLAVALDRAWGQGG